MGGEEDLVKKKKKKKTFEAENEECLDVKPKKKKKKNAESNKEPVEDVTLTATDEVQDEQKPCSSPKKKKKKKKTKSSDKDVSDSEEIPTTDNVEVVSEPKQKKKKRKREQEDSISPIAEDVSIEEKKHKKKKKKHRGSEDDEDKEQARSSGWDVKAPGHKEERKSGWDVKGPVETGQWGSASLGSDSRNDKFFRLMGGKKKGATGDAAGTFKQKFASQALNKTQEENLNDGLEKQYQNAWETTRQKRGKGLGYDGTVASLENKKAFDKDNTGTNSDSAKVETGQWGTASLGSDARNDKFFRLMGGKKKGSGGDTEGTFKQKFVSQALNKTQEQDLNAGLEKQYNDAWETTRQKKGLGLGFGV